MFRYAQHDNVPMQQLEVRNRTHTNENRTSRVRLKSRLQYFNDDAATRAVHATSIGIFAAWRDCRPQKQRLQNRLR